MKRFLLIRNTDCARYPSYSTEDWFAAFETRQEAVDYATLDRGQRRWSDYRYYIVDLVELLETGIIPEGEHLEFLEKEIVGGKE